MILENKAQCRNCGDILVSQTPSEPYQFCKCGAVGVAGGLQTILRVGHHADIVEMSVKAYQNHKTT